MQSAELFQLVFAFDLQEVLEPTEHIRWMKQAAAHICFLGQFSFSKQPHWWRPFKNTREPLKTDQSKQQLRHDRVFLADSNNC